ncbi:MAG: hypothetical protein JWP85_1492 [Rhodoglobus sp.]|nr:hypothetical protein [Rhodoglobus sp.]
MTPRLIAVATALGIAVSLAACSAEESESDRLNVNESGTWTVLTYSIADTNLEPFMMTDLEELGEVGTQEGLNLVALVDRSDGYTDVPVLGLDDWSGAKLIEIGQGEATELDDRGNINTGDPDVLASFIAEGIELYPADNYALVISDHGASWPGVGADGSFDNDTLSLAEIDSAISDGLAKSGVDRLDILGFDACLMATYEVASTLAPLADRLIASQELEPGHGWDYRAFDEVADDSTATADELGSAIIDGFKAQADFEGTAADITLSMVDLTQMSSVDAALKSFTDVLVERADGIGPTVGRTLAQTLGFGQSPDPSQDTHMTDLAIFTSQIGVDLLFASDAADELTRAINDAVLDRIDGQATQGATGLSIYFPPQVDYFDEDYRELPNLGGWMDFLTVYYDEGEAIEEEPVLDAGADITFGPDGVTIVGSFDDVTAENLSEAFIRYGVVELDGSVTFLGEEDAELSDDGSGTATGTYDLTFLTLSDGIDTTTAYLSLFGDRDSGIVTADVPLSYYSPDGEESGDLVLSAVIDTDTGETLAVTYYVFDEESGTYGEFAPEPDWIIVPVVLNVLEDGTEEWLLTSDVGLYADLDTLVYDLSQLPSGVQLYLELVVVDFGGDTDSVSGIVSIP